MVVVKHEIIYCTIRVYTHMSDRPRKIIYMKYCDMKMLQILGKHVTGSEKTDHFVMMHSGQKCCQGHEVGTLQ